MRILLMGEGDSDEIVADALIHRSYPDAVITPKRFAARGFQVVWRSIPTLVRAAHFGFFDVLVIHFDINGTLLPDFGSVTESKRFQNISMSVSESHNSLPDPGRTHALRTVLMAPCQSVEAWLGWGGEGGDGNLWERKAQKDLKKYLFGEPALNIVEKSKLRIPELISQMVGNPEWPISLREFDASLDRALNLR